MSLKEQAHGCISQVLIFGYEQLKRELEAAVLETEGVLEEMKGKLGAATNESDRGQRITADHAGSTAEPVTPPENTVGSTYADPKESSEATVGVFVWGHS